MLAVDEHVDAAPLLGRTAIVVGLLIAAAEDPRPLGSHGVQRAEQRLEEAHDVRRPALREDQVVQRSGISEAGVAEDLESRRR